MRILQISDFHLRGDGRLSFRVVDTPKCLETAARHLLNLVQKPDMMVITGDLADSVRVIAPRIGVEVSMRMTQYTYDCLTRKYTSVTLGTAADTLESSLFEDGRYRVNLSRDGRYIRFTRDVTGSAVAGKGLMRLPMLGRYVEFRSESEFPAYGENNEFRVLLDR